MWHRGNFIKWILSCSTPFFFTIVMLGGTLFFLTAPLGFPTNHVIQVAEGASLREIGEVLKERSIIRSSVLFMGIARMTRVDEAIQAGDYLFEDPLSLPRVLWRLSNGLHGITQVRIRLPEGATREQMATILEDSLDLFNKTEFLSLTKNKEGYLFPDTYFFFINDTAPKIATRLEESFMEQIEPYQDAIAASGKSLDEIVIMASIIEREAHDIEDQKLIGGVLWKRIEIDMALQVDAPFYFLFGKPSSELTRADLAVDSPYNTYTNRGLPPGAIGNPGITAIEAALFPTDSDYLYYLSDEEGVTHFAVTFEEHVANKEKYLY